MPSSKNPPQEKEKIPQNPQAPTSLSITPPIPQRQIRALYDDDTITVYQAYSAAIAIPAVKEQSLCASPAFRLGRMTWIKPSWCWMMYRSNYSHKDPNQSHILALKIPHHHFSHLLSLASVASTNHTGPMTAAEKAKPVRVQWDPERGPRGEVLPYRSIQIGISGELSERWAREWVVGIEDVTEAAVGLRRAVEGGGEVGEGLVPRERVYGVEEGVRRGLGMEVG